MGGTHVPTVDSSERQLTVDFLYWEDCPSHERALEMLKEVIEEEAVEAQLHLHQVETDEEAERLQFPGSPTIRINGADIDPPVDLPIGLTCRVYRHDNGRISPLPPKERVLHAVREASRAA